MYKISDDVTLPSKYRSPNSRNFPTVYFIFVAILFGSSAIAIYYGVLLSVDKYGPQILYGWTVENLLILIGYIAMFFLSVLFSRRLVKKIIGKAKLREMTDGEHIIFRFGSIILALVISSLGTWLIGFLVTDNLALDP